MKPNAMSQNRTILVNLNESGYLEVMARRSLNRRIIGYTHQSNKFVCHSLNTYRFLLAQTTEYAVDLQHPIEDQRGL